MDINRITSGQTRDNLISISHGGRDEQSVLPQDKVQFTTGSGIQDPTQQLKAFANAANLNSTTSASNVSSVNNLFLTNYEPEVVWKNDDCRRQINGRPLVDSDGSVYFGSSDYNLYHLDKDGNELWHKNLSGDVYASPIKDGSNNVLVSSSGKSVYAFTPDGKQVWNFRTNDSFTDSPVVGSDGSVYAGCCDHKMYGLTPSGDKKWEFDCPGTPSRPALDDQGNLYFSDVKNNLFSLDKDGNKRWSVELPDNTFEGPVIGPDKKLYVGCGDGKLYCINPDNGKTEWDVATNKNSWTIDSSPVFTKKGLILVSNQDGNLYAIDPQKKEVAWNYEVEGFDISAPVENEMGNIYVAGKDAIYCVSSTGQGLWKKTFEFDQISSELSLSPDGKMMFVGMQDGTFLAMKRKDMAATAADTTGSGTTGAAGEGGEQPKPEITHTDDGVDIDGVTLKKKKKGSIKSLVDLRNFLMMNIFRRI